MSRKSQILVGAALVALLSAPSFSHACDCHRRAAAVTYAPAPAVAVQSVGYSAAPVCSSCAPTSAMMPVSTYRAVYRPMAVTAYAPVGHSWGFLSGRTTYMPVTSVVYSPQVVAYAAYSPAPVVSAVAMPVTTAMPVVVPATTCSQCAAPAVAPCSQCSAATTTYRLGDAYSVVSSSVASSCPTGGCGTTVTAQMPLSTTIVPTASSTTITYPAPAPAPAPTVTPALPAPAAGSESPSTYSKQGAGSTPAPAAAPSGSQPTTPASPNGTLTPGSGTNTNANPSAAPAGQLNVRPAAQPVVRQAVYLVPAQPTTAPAATASGWHAVEE